MTEKKRPSGYHYVTYTQRLQLESLLKAKVPIKDIAVTLNLHISTIYRELKRGAHKQLRHKRNAKMKQINRYISVYAAEVAHRNFLNGQTAKGRPVKLKNDFEYVSYVQKRILRDKLSPFAIIGELRRKGNPFRTQVCVNTLYSYIRNGYIPRVTMSTLPLPKKRKKKRRVVPRKSPRGLSIEQRPLDILLRNVFGNWEMDCVCGSTKDCFLVLTERFSRYEIIFKMSSKKSQFVVDCLDFLEKKYAEHFSEIFKSITVDNGSEFSDYDGMRRSCFSVTGKRTEIYYCHPYSAYERGTNERINREIRRVVPKGTSLTPYTKYSVARVAAWINSYPRQVLGFATSQEVFDAELSKILS